MIIVVFASPVRRGGSLDDHRLCSLPEWPQARRLAVISVEQTQISLRQNSTIEQLTILATVFLPLTFVTGFFGQNFGWLVSHINGVAAFISYGIGGLILPMVLLFLWLRRGASAPATAAAPHDN
jgi:magnesium transporter